MPHDPFHGYHWLPPDTETAEANYAKLAEFHRANANAFWIGPEHVAREKAREAAALAALRSLQSFNRMKLEDDDVRRIADAVAERLLRKDEVAKVAHVITMRVLWSGLAVVLGIEALERIFR